jgi:SAM-dependent methyltransferase
MGSTEPDFSTRLHELRSAELRRLPAGADTVLHGGAAGAWYFNWFDENYSGDVKRHIGVEAFSPPPSDLPSNVEWLRKTLGDMNPVATGSVDMVFGGQVIEHLWPEDVAGFLSESHRVLRPGGRIVLDSPNRRITEAIAWHHPEHTAEFAVDEVAQLLVLAGFELEELRGVLLGYDSTNHAFLELEDDRLPWDDRAALAADRPEDSFVWWLVARRGDTEPNRETLNTRAQQLAETFRVRRLRRITSPLAIQRETGRIPWVDSSRAPGGPLISSPSTPFAEGRWQASFALRLSDSAIDPGLPVAFIDATSDSGATEHARRDVLAGTLDPNGAWTVVDLPFDLPGMTMGVELRAHGRGQAGLGAQLAIAVRQLSDLPIAAQELPASAPAHTPEPRTVEIIELLGQRAVSKAKAALRR